LAPSEILAVWGPGGADFNEALCVDRRVRCVISKASGEAGGVEAKAEAAKKLGIPLIMIRRPDEPDGLSCVSDVDGLLKWCKEKTNKS
jgi:precorrin-3B C17-methyltransferase